MKISVIGIIGIDLDEKYKWKDTLFLDSKVYSTDLNIYNNCKKYIKIRYKKEIDIEQARMIEKNIYACEEYLYDKEKKTKIYFENEDTCVIESDQESNEWLIIMLQIMLLKEGYSFIHAAAVANDKKEGLILPSWGGVGKTASVTKLINNNYKLLGDDLNIINKKGEIFGFPKKFVLYFYHKNLFPEVFEKKNINCNSKLNNLYTSIIPTVKKVLRHIPGLLSFARKHNPQSMKVSPFEIFGENSIEKKAKIKQIIWLDRLKEETKLTKIEKNEIISKSVSVTMHELFTENISALLIMCGMNILEYDEIFNNMYEIFEKAFEKAETTALNVENNLPVEEVPENILKNIKI